MGLNPSSGLVGVVFDVDSVAEAVAGEIRALSAVGLGSASPNVLLVDLVFVLFSVRLDFSFAMGTSA